MISNSNARKWVYVAQIVLGAVLVVLVAAGVIEQSQSDAVTQAVGGVVLMLTGELARRNVAQAPTIAPSDVQVITKALAQRAQEVVGVGAAEVDRARAELESRLGR